MNADFKYLVEVPGWSDKRDGLSISQGNNRQVTVSLPNGDEYEGDVVDTPDTMILKVIRDTEGVITGLKYIGNVHETIKCQSINS